MKLRYKLGLSAVAICTSVATIAACGGNDVTLGLTSTCADWNSDSSTTQDAYITSDAQTDNVSASQFADQVSAACNGNDSLNLTGVISSVAITEAG